jgi:hypothetical protein
MSYFDTRQNEDIYRKVHAGIFHIPLHGVSTYYQNRLIRIKVDKKLS